jgi:hypothetical protein
LSAANGHLLIADVAVDVVAVDAAVAAAVDVCGQWPKTK